MTKFFHILIVTLFSIFSFGQQITFVPNINPDAQELQQLLTENGSHLVLESAKRIRQIDIIDDDFFKTIKVDSTKTEIDLNKLPNGNFIIKASLGRKRIVMYLIKEEVNSSSATNIELVATKEGEIISTLTKKHNVIRPRASQSHQSNSVPQQDKTLYWVVRHSNASFGANKSMSLEYKDRVSHLISKNKLELKTDVAKNNRLLIYEVYNRSKFMTKQLRNQHYYKSKNSEVFNVVPIYSSLYPNKMTP